MNYRELEVPCFQCKDRHMGCHGKCEKYAAFVKKNRKQKEEMFKEKEITGALNENVRKWAKRSKKYLRNVYY